MRVNNEGEGTLVFRSTNIQNGKICLKNNVYVNKKISKKLTTHTGDILICSRNGSRNLIGKNALITDESSGNSFGAFTTVFRTEYYDFIYYIMNSELFKYQSGLFLTSTINQLTTGTLKNFEIPLPPAKEQEKIVEHINAKILPLEDLEKKVLESTQKLKETRTSIITEAVTGQLDIEAWKNRSTVECRLDEIQKEMAS